MFKGLPTQVRDSVLPETDPIPQSDVHREYFADQAQKKVCVARRTNDAPSEQLVCDLSLFKSNWQLTARLVVPLDCRGRDRLGKGTDQPHAKQARTTRTLLPTQSITYLLVLCQGNVYAR
jgi:hypothetical protein